MDLEEQYTCGNSELQINDTVLSGNRAHQRGGGAIYVSMSYSNSYDIVRYNHNLQMHNTVIYGNRANLGGAVYIYCHSNNGQGTLNFSHQIHNAVFFTIMMQIKEEQYYYAYTIEDHIVEIYFSLKYITQLLITTELLQVVVELYTYIRGEVLTIEY